MSDVNDSNSRNDSLKTQYFLCDWGQLSFSWKPFIFMAARHQGITPVLYNGVYLVPKPFQFQESGQTVLS